MKNIYCSKEEKLRIENERLKKGYMMKGDSLYLIFQFQSAKIAL